MMQAMKKNGVALSFEPEFRLMWAVLGIALVTSVATPALAADPVRGGALAERWCTACHVVADDVPGGTLGPAFSGIVPLRGRDEASLKVWLAAPHEPMPDFNLSAREINDIVAYILSLNTE